MVVSLVWAVKKFLVCSWEVWKSDVRSPMSEVWSPKVGATERPNEIAPIHSFTHSKFDHFLLEVRKLGRPKDRKRWRLFTHSLIQNSIIFCWRSGSPKDRKTERDGAYSFTHSFKIQSFLLEVRKLESPKDRKRWRLFTHSLIQNSIIFCWRSESWDDRKTERNSAYSLIHSFKIRSFFVRSPKVGTTERPNEMAPIQSLTHSKFNHFCWKSGSWKVRKTEGDGAYSLIHSFKIQSFFSE
jgi:hypothetical protein